MTVQTTDNNAVANQNDLDFMLFNEQAMQQMYKLAEVMASGNSTVPAHLQGNKADCMAIVMQASQWKMNPFSVAQKTFLIKGVLGYEAQLINAVITSMAPTKDRLSFRPNGDWDKIFGRTKQETGRDGKQKLAGAWSAEEEHNLGVTVSATMKDEDEPRELTLRLSQAHVRNSTLWASNPLQQLSYLAIKNWARLNCPDVILGVYSGDELEEREVNPLGPTENKSATNGRTTSINAGKKRGNVYDHPASEQTMEQPQDNAPQSYDASQNDRFDSQGYPGDQPFHPEDMAEHNDNNPFMAGKRPQTEETAPGQTQRPVGAPAVESHLERLAQCQTNEDLEKWKERAGRWPEGSNERNKLIEGYKTHKQKLVNGE